MTTTGVSVYNVSMTMRKGGLLLHQQHKNIRTQALRVLDLHLQRPRHHLPQRPHPRRAQLETVQRCVVGCVHVRV